MGQPAALGATFCSIEKGVRPQQRNVSLSRSSGAPWSSGSLKKRVDSVQRFDAFAELSASDCATIVADAGEMQVHRHSVLFVQGTPATQVALLLSGCLKVTQGSSHGQEVILRLNGPGDLLGKIVSSAHGSHLHTTRAVQTSAVLVWEMESFEALTERFPTLRRNIANILERQLTELEIRYREVSTEKVSARLSNLLVRLVSQVGRRLEDSVEIALSRRELAQLTGTTLFTVSRLLCQWETLGIVSARREAVLVHDQAALLELAREE